MTISLHQPFLDNQDLKLLKNAFQSNWISSGGNYTNKFENLLKKKLNSKNLTCLINGTSSLQISLKIAGVKTGDEVIVPTTTFVATINSIIYNSAKPLFFDIDDYFNLDEEKVIDFLTKHTFTKNRNVYNKFTKNKISAIIIVHTFGNACFFENLYNFCKDKNIKIIEDAAESLGTYYKTGKFKKKYTGTIGFAGCLSFNGNKIVTSGGGGAIISKNKNIIKKVNHLITQAKTDPINFIHDQVGYNMKISNLHSSIGYSQLKKIEKFIKIKKEIHKTYLKKFEEFEEFKIMKTPRYSSNNYWLNILEIKTKNNKYASEVLIKKLIKNNIDSRSVWFPNHLQKPFKKFFHYKIDKAIKKTKNALCLPSSCNLKISEIHKIVYLLTNRN